MESWAELALGLRAWQRFRGIEPEGSLLALAVFSVFRGQFPPLAGYFNAEVKDICSQ